MVTICAVCTFSLGCQYERYRLSAKTLSEMTPSYSLTEFCLVKQLSLLTFC